MHVVWAEFFFLSLVLCVLLSETTGEQVSEYWSSGCHDYLHEPGVYVVKLKKEVQKSSAAGHVHHLLLDVSASSATLTVSQQEFLVQFSFHGDGRERYALFKQEERQLEVFSVPVFSVFGLLTWWQTFGEPQTSP